jgi:phosphoglycerate-specific signal transduction histidine kinase
MSRQHDLDLRYLHALMELNPFLAHELNNHLQAVSIQLTLIRGILQRAQPGDAAAWEKLNTHALKAEQAYQILEKTAWRNLATISPPERSVASLDLRDVIQSLQRLLAPHFKDKQKELQVSLPDHPLTLEGSRDVIQRSLLVILVAASLAVNQLERLDLKLDVDGTLEIEGPPAHQWLPAVADIIENIGGGFDSGPSGSVVAMRIPIQTRTR